jgi:hypothetical protein
MDLQSNQISIAILNNKKPHQFLSPSTLRLFDLVIFQDHDMMDLLIFH